MPIVKPEFDSLMESINQSEFGYCHSIKINDVDSPASCTVRNTCMKGNMGVVAAIGVIFSHQIVKSVAENWQNLCIRHE